MFLPTWGPLPSRIPRPLAVKPADLRRVILVCVIGDYPCQIWTADGSKMGSRTQ